ncbi:MAG: L,D-transpeptidase family protein [Sulfurimonas sp.]|nr:L,D-transpeptidase family protein [Sulfurimonas sp.]
MVKTFLILVICYMFLYSNEQIILVTSDSINTNKATLSCFENGKKVFNDIKVNLGKNGLGIGIGHLELKHQKDEVIKVEGDKKAPIGIFRLTSVFGYADSEDTHMPYIKATKNLICVDDSDSIYYNQIINMPKQKPKSYELMRRDDNQYEIGIVVEHNKQQVAQAGSCIFFHVQKDEDPPTAGCTSMSLQNIKKIVKWLDIKKNPILIQVPKKYLGEVKKMYPELPLD